MNMKTNYVPRTKKVTKSSLKERMDAFDCLPIEIRIALSNSPINFSSISALKLYYSGKTVSYLINLIEVSNKELLITI